MAAVVNNLSLDQGADFSFQVDAKVASWVISIGGSPPGGIWTGALGLALPINTAAIAYNASAAAVSAAWQGLGSVGASGVKSCTGGSGGPWTITFSDELVASTANAAPTVNGAGLTAFGGSVTVTQKALDLTGYTAKMQIRNAIDGTVYQTLTTGSGITLGGALGTVLVSLTAAQTNAFSAWTSAVYDLYITGGGTTTYLVYGTITNRLQVTI